MPNRGADVVELHLQLCHPHQLDIQLTMDVLDLALDDAKHAYDLAGVSEWDHAVLLFIRGAVLHRLAQIEAEDCAQDSAVVFARADDKIRYLHARMLQASVKHSRQDFAGARDDYKSLIPLAEEEGDQVLVARLAAAAADCDMEIGDAAAAKGPLLSALKVFENAGLDTAAAVIRWALARIPLLEGRFAVATTLLRACKRECERLGARSDAALIALDLADVLVAMGQQNREVERLCREAYAVFKRAGMLNEALTALGYLREAARAKTITRNKIRHVRRFLVRLEEQPTITFDPPAG